MWNGFPWRRKRSRNFDKAQADVTSLGRILIECGYATDEEVASAVAYQRRNEELVLGELLIKRGAITREVLEVALAKQRAVRRRKDADVIAFARATTRRSLSLSADVAGVAQAYAKGESGD